MAVRRLTVEDAGSYRTLRLEALKSAPTAFGSSYEDSANLPLSAFAKRVATSERSAIYGAFAAVTSDAVTSDAVTGDAGALVGTVGLYREQGSKERHKAVLFGMYVSPPARRKGVARELVSAVLGFARGMEQVEQVKLAVEATNIAARALYGSFGFEEFGREERALFVDGRYYDEIHMVLFFDRHAGQDAVDPVGSEQRV